MPTRKQRRRRQKEQRHEYEYVYVDEAGHEVEVEEEQPKPRSDRRNGKRDSKPAQKGRAGRPIKQVAPPSWSRVAKRALLFAPLIFLAFSVINSSQPVLNRLVITVVYTAFFVPFMYVMDRAMYRSYLRRSGKQPPPRGAPKKR